MAHLTEQVVCDFKTMLWYSIRYDPNEIIRSAEGIDEHINSLKDIKERFYYYGYNGTWFDGFLWITNKNEMIIFEEEVIWKLIEDKKITREILKKLKTKRSIELYLSLLEL